MPNLDVLTATAADVVALLESGKATSEEIVGIYLDQIEKHNRQGLKLLAVISVSRRHALEQAKILDKERKDGKTRGPLHGVPILIKDCIQTSAELGMTTTGGAAVFKDAVAREDAEVVRRLRQQGLIILAKASLTEFCGNKAKETTTGWSAVNGQTQSAWVEGGYRQGDVFWGRSTSGGSSSGSAVGVAAGFAPISVGTETSGSLVMPSNRAGLYSLKLSHEREILAGALPLCMAFDSLGAIARGAEDLELLVKAMTRPREIKVEKKEWKDMKIGLIDPHSFGPVPSDEKDQDESHLQILKEYEEVREQLKKLGAKVEYPVKLMGLGELQHKDNSVLQPTSFVDVKEHWPEWIGRMDNPNWPKVKTFADIVNWNEAHPELGMPSPHQDQDDLKLAINSKLTRIETDEIESVCYPMARDAVEKCLTENEVDIIIGPGDNAMCVHASVGKLPSGTVPVGILSGEKGMGQPQGLMLMTRRFEEGRLLEFMKLWEGHHGVWKAATRLRTGK